MLPSGLLVMHNDAVYRTSGNRLYPLISWNAALSWNQYIVILDDDGEYYIEKQNIGFRPGSILEYNKVFYIIEGNIKRQMSNEYMERYKFNEFESILITQYELDFHKTGDPIG